MNVWLVSGGIYLATVLFALALCRVGAPTNQGDIQARACAIEPTADPTEYERLVGHGEDQADVTIHRATSHNKTLEAPGSRPKARSQGSRDLRKDSRWPQPSPSAETSAAPRS